MAKGNYEISAKLTIDNKRAKKALTDTTKQISELNKMNNKFIDSEKKKAQVQKEIKKEQDKVNKAYKTGSGAVNKLVSGLNHENRANKQLVNSIKNTHVALTRHNASTEKYVGTMQKLASANGLAFRNGTFVDSLKDINLKTATVGKTTENTTKAINDFSKGFNNLRKSLKGNENNLGNFEKGIRDLRQRMYRDYKVSISSGANGIYSFTDVQEKEAQKRLALQEKEAQKNLALMNRYSKSLNDGLNKAFSVQRYTPNLSALTNGINSFRLGNSGLNAEINDLNNKLVKQNATVKEANKAWSDFAKSRGLIYKDNKLYSHLKDDDLNIKKIGNDVNRTAKSTNVLNKAINEYKQGYIGLQNQLHKGLIDQTRFNSGINNLSKDIKSKYKINIIDAGDANYKFSNSVNDVQSALKKYTTSLRTTNSMLKAGTFSSYEAKMLRLQRDEVGRLVLGHEKYNKILASGGYEARNAFKQVNSYIQKNYDKLGITETQARAVNTAFGRWSNTFNSIGGSIDVITNKTGNYNKLLTTTTRSQRMQNYAMQVGAMRYNAIGTMAGFVGGMLTQQLAMGFVEARIQAVKFEQQAQQMFKTSDLSAKSVKNLTEAVEDYTESHRKLNTQGLKYTIAQVTKLNGLSEAEAKKAIPVIADISNMMQINGRTQEESILAVNDALDGQFKRLQEIGVQGKDQLKSLGWTGKLNSSKDTMSLLDALEKLGKRKGWSDLTSDISTLDDAYNLLGNTIDDVLTPSMVQITPLVVKTIQGFSGLFNVLTSMPIPIQMVASGLGVLGVAFGKMKFEMLKGKMYGSEFFARLTGLDDGMYGISKSAGAVTTAVTDEAISFQEGTRALQNYHKSTVKSLMTFDELSVKINENRAEYELLNKQLEANAISNTSNVKNRMMEIENEQAQLRLMQNSSNSYAVQHLALSNMNKERLREINLLSKSTGLTKTEIGLLLSNTGMINKTTGEIKSLSNGTSTFNKALREMGVSSRMFSDSYTSSIMAMRNGSNQSKKLQGIINGVTKAEKLNTVATKLDTEAHVLYNKIINGTITKDKLVNNLTKKGVSVKKANSLATIAMTEAETLHNIQQQRNASGFTNFKKAVTNAGSSIKNFFTRNVVDSFKKLVSMNVGISQTILKFVGLAGAEETAEGASVMLATSLGLVETALLGIVAVGAIAFLGGLISKQISLNNSIKEFNDLVENGDEKNDKLIAQLKKLKKGTDEYNAVLARSKHLQQETDDAKNLDKKSDYVYGVSVGRVDDVSDKLSKDLKKQGIDFNYDAILEAKTEIESLNDVETEFGLTVKKRVKSLNEQLKLSGKSNEEVAKFNQSYLKHQEDVLKATEKMKSDDSMERLGGYWDNWWARMAMQWDEFFAGDWGAKISNLFKINWGGEIITQIGNELADFDIMKVIQDALFPKAVSAEDGSDTGGGLTHEDWIRFIGIDPTTLPQEFSDAINNFGSTAWTSIYNFGNGIYTNFMKGLGDLGKIINDKINDVINSILNAPAKIATDAWNFGKSIYSNFKRGLGDLGKIVTDEIDEIGQAILDAPKNIAQSAWNFGKAIVDGVNKEVDHHSPGTIARWIRDDVNYINEFLKSGISSSGNIAQTYGKSIVDNFGEVELTPKTNTKGVINDNNAIMSSTYEAQKYTANEYNTMTNNVTDAFGIMSNTANSDMNSVAMNNAKYLVKMNNDTKTNMTQIQTTNNGKLQAMQSSTLTATNSMSKAWGSMKNSIVNCASQIRTQSYSKFESLHRTISSFYNQIQNAHFGSLSAGYAGSAGGATVPRVRRPSVRRSSLNTSSNKDSLSGLQIEGNFFDLLPKMKKVIGEDILIKMMNGLGDNYSAGINVGAVANRHTNKILDSAKRWKIKSPKFLGVTLPSNYTVGDFLNGNTPSNPLNGDFESVLTSICTERGFRNPNTYEFYYNSRKSNQEVWDSVGCNCYDGAEMIVAIANMLGLSGHLVNGHWGSIAHTGAMINGKLFDMTQFQKRGVWRGTSGVNFAGSPDTGKRIKWSSAGKGKLISSGTTNNSNSNVVHVTITGNTFIGEKDYKKQMKSIAEDVFYDNMSINPCTGI